MDQMQILHLIHIITLAGAITMEMGTAIAPAIVQTHILTVIRVIPTDRTVTITTKKLVLERPSAAIIAYHLSLWKPIRKKISIKLD